MENGIFGVFKALVTDVDCFLETGMIKTRISVLNDFYVNKDLRDKYDLDRFREDVDKDIYTQVFIPFGGGYNSGMFKLPPLNSLGLVTFIDGKSDNPIWLGGIPNTLYTKSGILHTSNAPSDSATSGDSIITFDENEKKGKMNSEDLNSFVLKTKNNSLDDLSNPESMNWEDRRVENSIILNKKRMELTHLEESGDTQGITLTDKIEHDGKQYSIKIIDDKGNSNKSSVYMGESGISIEVAKGSLVSKIELGEETIEIKMKRDELETSIVQREDEIRLKNENSEVILKKENLSDEIVLKSPRVSISSEDIILGNGDYRLVISPTNFNVSLEDGTMLTTARNVRV